MIKTLFYEFDGIVIWMPRSTSAVLSDEHMDFLRSPADSATMLRWLREKMGLPEPREELSSEEKLLRAIFGRCCLDQETTNMDDYDWDHMHDEVWLHHVTTDYCSECAFLMMVLGDPVAQGCTCDPRKSHIAECRSRLLQRSYGLTEH